MRYLVTCFCLSFIIAVSNLDAQSDKRLGGLFNINYKFSPVEPWTTNLSLETRQILREYDASGEQLWKGYRFERTDFTILVGRRSGFNAHVDAGYMLRRAGQIWVHRTIQQYAWVNKLRVWRIGHRIRTDQTFRTSSAPAFRLRYRISGDRPLSGENLNTGEWYLKWYNEHLPKIQGKETSYEMRLGFAFGHYFSDNNKLEVGLDTRFGDLGLHIKDEQYWLTASWYVSM